LSPDGSRGWSGCLPRITPAGTGGFLQPDEAVKVTVLRDGQRRTLNVTLR
jgi:hypothetical protein